MYPGLLGAAAAQDCYLGIRLLLLNWPGHNSWFVILLLFAVLYMLRPRNLNVNILMVALIRISSSLGSLFLFGLPSPSRLACGFWRRRCTRLYSLVGARPPCSPPLHRHRSRSLFRPQRSPLFALWLDGYKTEPQTHRPDRYL